MTATQKKFAEGTTVPVERSRGEIERTLARYKATGFMYGSQGDRAMIAFELQGRRYRMDLLYPGLEEFSEQRPVVNQYTRKRTREEAQEEAQEKEKQRLWRGLALLVKAKLEAVSSGITTLEEELLPYTVMPSGETVSEWLEPQLEEVYRSGQMPSMLAPHPRRRMIESGGGR
jgi:hypothetical protein